MMHKWTNKSQLTGENLRSNNLKSLGAIFSVVSGKCSQIYCLLFPHYVRYVIMM